MSATNAQFQSPLFSRLPAEIRQQIYEEVLGSVNGRVQVLRTQDGFTYVRCLPGVHPHTPKEREDDRRLLTLQQTCKAIHNEAHKILYSHNIFFLKVNMHQRNPSFVDFTNSIREDCLLSIRHLDLLCTFASMRRTGARTIVSGNMDYWIPVCAQLERMKGLQKLYLTVRIDSGPWIPPNTDGWFQDVFRPLMPVRVPKFVVTMGFDIPRSARSWLETQSGMDLGFELIVDESVQPKGDWWSSGGNGHPRHVIDLSSGGNWP